MLANRAFLDVSLLRLFHLQLPRFSVKSKRGYFLTVIHSIFVRLGKIGVVRDEKRNFRDTQRKSLVDRLGFEGQLIIILAIQSFIVTL
jgi:hypothetical protein